MLHSVTHKPTSSEDFDYSALDTETLSFVREQTGEIRLLMKRTARDIISIGQKLIEIKELLGHGQYRKWIKTEFNWGKSTANSFENVAKRFANVQNLDIFTPSVLYELAAPSTPESARQEAIARAEAGEKIGYKSAKEIKKKHITQLAGLKSELPKQLGSATKTQQEENFLSPSTLSEQPEQQQHSVKQKTIIRPEKASSANSLLEIEPEVIRAGSWRQLGQNHLLYCGDPHSSKLQTQLPKRIALAISFPPTANWNLGSIESKVNSSLILFSQYEDIDLKSLREIVRNALELYTSERETVIFSFLPDPILLMLAEQLACCCIIAEPDIIRCQNIVRAWTQTGGKVKVLNSQTD